MENEEYTFNLSDEYKSIALRDLREDDLIRKQSLEQMTEWIKKHPYIKSCRTGKFPPQIVLIELKRQYYLQTQNFSWHSYAKRNSIQWKSAYY